MIIICPNCNKQFKINSSLIPYNGRDLKCGSCYNIWFYKIEDDKTEPLPLSDDFADKKIVDKIDNRIVDNNIIEPNDVSAQKDWADARSSGDKVAAKAAEDAFMAAKKVEQTASLEAAAAVAASSVSSQTKPVTKFIWGESATAAGSQVTKTATTAAVTTIWLKT